MEGVGSIIKANVSLGIEKPVKIFVQGSDKIQLAACVWVA